MNILIVTTHSDPQSLNARLHNATLSVLQRAEHDITVSELFSQSFNPVASTLDFNTRSSGSVEYVLEQQRAMNTGSGFSADIQAEMEKVTAADLIILNFQARMSAIPALLSGWIERVFAMGYAWNEVERYSSGKLSGKRVLCVITSGDPEEAYRPEGIHNASLTQHLYGFLHSNLAMTGLDVLKPHIIYNTVSAESGELDLRINQYMGFIETIESNQDFIYKHSS